MTHTDERPTLAWTVRTELTEAVRSRLVSCLEAEFTDEPRHRSGIRFPPDTRVVVSPDIDELPQFRLVLHWGPCADDLPLTDVNWMTEHVQRAIRLVSGGPAGAPETISR